MARDDEHEIAKLIIGYARATDAADWERVAGLYVEDGRMSRPVAPDVFVVGREAILAAFLARPPRATRHICTNISVDVSGDTATASSSLLLFTAQSTPPLIGGYNDALGRTGDGWRFSERRGWLDFA